MSGFLIEARGARARWGDYVGEAVVLIVFDQIHGVVETGGVMRSAVAPAGSGWPGSEKQVYGVFVPEDSARKEVVLLAGWSAGAGVIRETGVSVGRDHFRLQTWGPVAASEAMKELLRARLKVEVLAQVRDLMRHLEPGRSGFWDGVALDEALERLRVCDDAVAALCGRRA